MKKKINLLLFFITVSFSINAQAITTTYTTRNFGSNLSQASNQFCSTNAITNGYNFRVNVISTTSNPLQTNKLYKFLDENTVYYIYVVSKNTNIDNDRDSFGLDNFELQNITCTYETGYNIRDLGTNYTTASNLVCSSSASTSGNSYRINVLSQIPTNPLQTNKLYKFTDDNIVKYLYIVSKMSAPASDTDSYYENNYIIQNPFCDSDSDGIEDSIDNCKTTYNPNQLDTDGDGKGDICDNCPSNSNSNQSDIDGDGIGDVCDSDKDGDGVPNSSDNCPTQPGPTSNNGCPLPTGFADLTINKNNVYIYSNCSDCNSNLGSLGSKRHILNRAYSGILNIQQIIIDNIGAVTSTNSNLKFYLSTNATLSSDDYYFNNRDVTLTSISPNDYLLKQQSIFAVDIPSNKAYGNYHILIIIDKDGSVNEGPNGGENNNLITIPISYINMTNRTPPTLDKNQFNNIQKNNNELITKSYDLSIYDFSGTLIKFSTINSLEQESEIISTLPSGLYIIKTPLETRKISK